MNTPYGGELVDLIVSDARAAEMKAQASDLATLTLDERGLCDLEQLAVGGFSPLTGFLRQADYKRVVSEGRLADGTLWPLPITLPVVPGDRVEVGKTLALRDVYGNLLAFLHIDEIYESDKQAEASAVLGTHDPNHPGLAHLNAQADHYAAGSLEVIRTPPHYDFVELRRTPRELRDRFKALGWMKIVGHPASTPLHRAQEASVRHAAEQVGGGLLIHPSVGVTKPGDVDHFTRVRCFRALVDNEFDPGSVVLSLLPFASRHAGGREALLHAIVRRNYGCTHFIAPVDSKGSIPGSTWATLKQHEAEIGLEIVGSPEMIYLVDEDRYTPADTVPAGARTAALTDAQVHDDYLAKGIPLPDWYTRPAIAEILRESNRPRFEQGLTIWFTGLSGSGKSTVAHALVERLAEYGRNVSLLDGDEIRTHLSKGLGFSKEDRDINIRRVGYVAGMVAQHGGTTLCSVISPYRAMRDEARRLSKGNFIEVFCDTPLAVCESRDVKGLYAKARTAASEGKPMGFTGIDDPYEAPLNPEVTIDTSKLGVQAAADRIIEKILELGYILPHGHRDTHR